jgi:hypothetical protein
MVGALVLPVARVGITEASITRRPSTPLPARLPLAQDLLAVAQQR